MAVSRWYIFVSFRNKVDIIVHYADSPFWVYADANKDDLNDAECPILYFKCDFRMTHVRLLWVSEPTMCD